MSERLGAYWRVFLDVGVSLWILWLLLAAVLAWLLGF